jgi:hypothetical protein
MHTARDTGHARADNPAIPSRRGLLAAATSAPAANDAALIRLGALFEDAWNAESLAWIDYGELDAGAPGEAAAAEIAKRATERTSAIVAQIETTPARTLPGLLIKRRAIAWCVSDDRFTLENPTDMRLITSMLEDMTAIGSGLAAAASLATPCVPDDAELIAACDRIVAIRAELVAINAADPRALDVGPLHARYEALMDERGAIEDRVYDMATPATPAGAQAVARAALAGHERASDGFPRLLMRT